MEERERLTFCCRVTVVLPGEQRVGQGSKHQVIFVQCSNHQTSTCILVEHNIYLKSRCQLCEKRVTKVKLVRLLFCFFLCVCSRIGDSFCEKELDGT